MVRVDAPTGSRDASDPSSGAMHLRVDSSRGLSGRGPGAPGGRRSAGRDYELRRDRCFPEHVWRGDATHPQAREGRRAGPPSVTTKRTPLGRSVDFARRSMQTRPPRSSQAMYGRAVFVGEQLRRGDHQGRIFGDERPQAGRAPASRRSGRPGRWRRRAASRFRRRDEQAEDQRTPAGPVAAASPTVLGCRICAPRGTPAPRHPPMQPTMLACRAAAGSSGLPAGPRPRSPSPPCRRFRRRGPPGRRSRRRRGRRGSPARVAASSATTPWSSSRRAKAAPR